MSKSKSIIKMVVGITLALGGVTLINYFAQQIKKLKDSCYKLIGIRNLKMKGGDDLSMTIIVSFENKSDLTVELIKQEYDVSINDKYVATFKSPLDIKVKAHEKTPIEIDIKISPKQLLVAGLTNLEGLLFDKSKLRVGLDGKITAKAGIMIVKDMPFKAQWTLAELLTPLPEKEQKC